MDISTIAEPFRNFYYALEDKWYDLLDYLDNHIPVYKVIDPIDSVVPSFIVFLLVVIFLVVLGAYLVQFGSYSGIEFHTIDSKTKANLSGVTIYGDINSISFDEVTDETGISVITLESGTQNIFDQIKNVLFGIQKNELYATVSAEKAGYNSIANTRINISTKKATISLVKNENAGQEGNVDFLENYPNNTNVTLVDALTDEAIIDDTGSAYVRFGCANKSTISKTAEDLDDGDLDGKFTLNQEECQFVVTTAYSPGYEAPTNLPRTLPIAINEHRISLSRIRSTPSGTVKIYTAEKNSNPEKMIPKVQVTLLDKYNLTAARKLTDNSGVAMFTDIEAGTYKIIAASTDGNYASIRVDENITITAVSGATREKKIYLEKIDPTLLRLINVQLRDEDTDAIISGAKAYVQEIITSGNTTSLNPLAGCINNCVSDSSGIVKLTGLRTTDINKVLMIVNKPGYVIKIFKPILVKSIDPPTIEYMEGINSTNSGNARVNVKSTSNGAAIRDAKAYLYVNLLEPKVQRVQLFEDGIYTNSEGNAIFNSLPIGLDKNYVARATYDTLDSGYSIAKQVLAGQTTDFNLSIALEAAYIRVLLLDANNGQIIPTRADANVVLYSSNRPTEILRYDGTSARFVSSMYPRTTAFTLEADLNNYAGAVVEIPIGNLSNGANDFNIQLYPLSMLDGNVNIFFKGFYRNNFDLTREKNKVNIITPTNQHDDGTFGYYAKIDIVGGKDLNYSDLFGAIRFNDTMRIVSIPFKTEKNYLESGYYLCSPQVIDPVNPDEFYIQTDANCQRNDTNTTGAMAGIHWEQINSSQKKLKQTIYSMAVKTVFGEVTTDSLINIKGFGKEKHDTLTSEDRFDITYQLGTPITPPDNNALISILLTMNTTLIPRNSNGFEYDAIKKTYTESSQSQTKINVYQKNDFGIKIKNDSNFSLQNVKLSVYAYSGLTEEFNYIPSGSIRFDSSTTGTLAKQLTPITTLNKGATSTQQTVSLYSSVPNSTSNIVVVATIADKNYIFFADTKTVGLQLMLSGARFMADMMDQNFDAEVFLTNSRAPVELESVDLTTRKNCGTQNSRIIVNELPATIDSTRTNYFEKMVPGIYKQGTDCITVHAVAKNSNYAELTKTIYAGYSMLQDLTLSCVDASFPDTLGDSDMEEISAPWNTDFDIRIINTCAGPMQISIESGLTPVSNTCGILNPMQECSAKIKAINKTFDPTIKFSDVLGVFPVYIKARDAKTSKKLALADQLKVHIANPSDCYQIIQKDIYEAKTQPFKDNMTIQNNCQNTLVDDYYIPREVLSMIGADVNMHNPKYQSIDFNYDIVVRGGGFDVSTTQVSRIASIFFPDQPVQGMAVLGNGASGFKKYGQFHFAIPDYGGQTDLFYFRWSDRNDGMNHHGAMIADSITVNYRDGTKKDVNTNIATFDIATLPIACKCFDTRYTSDSCTDAQHMDVINGNGTFIGEHCMLIKNDLADGVDENEGIGGLMYVYVPRGNVESIDFNIYGNPNPEHLRISGLSWVKYNEDIKTLTPNGSSNLTVLNSGGFRIYPIEGYTYILKNLADTSISKQLQERINLCKKVQSAEAWYFKDKIFWTKRSITNFYEAKSFCSDSNGIGIDLTGTIPRLAILNDVVGVNSAFLVSTLTNNQDLLWNTTTADGGWVDGSTLKGFWIDYSIGENYYPLQKFDWYYYTGTGVDPGVAEYAPLCAAEINNSRGVTKAMCTSLGITCDKTNGRCTAPDPSSFTAFNSNAYLKTSNPLIEVNIKSVSSGGKAIDSNSVVVWVEGGQLKARYIGENYALYDDQTIESDIIAKDVKGDQYGTLTIIDYINNPED